MAMYKCIVCDKNGKKTELLKEAATEESLIQSFTSSSLFLLNYSLIDEKKNNIIKKRFSNKVLIEFTDIFASMLDSNLSIQDSLLLINEISENIKVKQLSKELHSEILHGKTLHDSLSLFPTTFSSLYRGMARLSERTGNPKEIFNHLSTFLHKTDETKQKIIEALTYPILVICFAILCCILLIIYVLPKLIQILIQFDSSSIEVVQKIESLRIFIFVFIIVLCIFFILYFILKRLCIKNNILAEIRDKILLKMPFIGNYFLSKQTLDFSFAMELLTNAGRNIPDALKDSALSISNLYYKKSIYDVHKELEKGKILSSAFEAVKFFPSYVVTWIKIGEKTGNVENVFSQIHKYFQTQVERNLKKIYIYLEPILILLAGIIIILIITNFILPIFNMYGAVL
ncbi:MAG: type II secretion system F family protein [Spirochaetaceae bacterium]|nr:type II secretion system F family protein [Spirochaetaceae bacterium]